MSPHRREPSARDFRIPPLPSPRTTGSSQESPWLHPTHPLPPEDIRRTLQARPIRTLAAAMAIAIASLVAAAVPASAAPFHNHCNFDRFSNSCLRFEGSTAFFNWDAHVGIDVHMPEQYGREILACGPDFRASLWGDDGNTDQFIRNLQLKPGWPVAGTGGISAEFFGQLLRPSEMNEDTNGEDELYVRISFDDCHTGDTRPFTTGIVRGEFRR